MKKRACAVLAVLTAAALLLTACGKQPEASDPEPVLKHEVVTDPSGEIVTDESGEPMTEVYEEVPVLDDEGNPVLDEQGEPVTKKVPVHASPNAPSGAASPSSDSQQPSSAPDSTKRSGSGGGSTDGGTPSVPSTQPKPAPTDPPKPADPTSPTEPAPTQPTEPEPTQPTEPPAKFDPQECIDYAIQYGKSIGLTYFAEAWGAWDTPITTKAKNPEKATAYVKEDMAYMLDWYKSDGMTYFSVWWEFGSLNPGEYEFYICYGGNNN